MIKIGDKVRFLDSIGGGIVRRFGNKGLVMVEDEDGFEIPVLASQCVTVNDDDDARASGTVRPKETPRQPQRFESTARHTSSSDTPEAITRLNDARTDIDLKRASTPGIERQGGDTLNCVLAFLADNSRRISDTDFLVYLVNDSNYWLFFTLLSPTNPSNHQQPNVECRFTGLIEPNTKQRLFALKRQDTEQLANCSVQLIAFKRDRAFNPQSPMHVDIRLNPNRFYKLHSFVENDYFDEEALLQPIVRNGRPYLPITLDEEALSRGIREKVKNQRNQTPTKGNKEPDSPLPFATIKDEIVEVDLHIHSLLDNTAGMSNNDILEYQLDIFHKTMQTYRNKRNQKIVFIHGKGEGVLRKAVIDELKHTYPKCQWQDASFRQYGFGATMVTIKP